MVTKIDHDGIQIIVTHESGQASIEIKAKNKYQKIEIIDAEDVKQTEKHRVLLVYNNAECDMWYN